MLGGNNIDMVGLDSWEKGDSGIKLRVTYGLESFVTIKIVRGRGRSWLFSP